MRLAQPLSDGHHLADRPPGAEHRPGGGVARRVKQRRPQPGHDLLQPPDHEVALADPGELRAVVIERQHTGDLRLTAFMSTSARPPMVARTVPSRSWHTAGRTRGRPPQPARTAPRGVIVNVSEAMASPRRFGMRYVLAIISIMIVDS